MWTRPEQSMPRSVMPPQRYGTPRYERATSTGEPDASASNSPSPSSSCSARTGATSTEHLCAVSTSGVARDLRLEHRRHPRPIVVDDRVPGRVADRVGQDHVLAGDPFEARPYPEESTADAQVAGVRSEERRVGKECR